MILDDNNNSDTSGDRFSLFLHLFIYLSKPEGFLKGTPKTPPPLHRLLSLFPSAHLQGSFPPLFNANMALDSDADNGVNQPIFPHDQQGLGCL